MNWKLISCILCMFGCFKEFRPSESFVTDYLTGPWKNFTDVQVNKDIYPVNTYSYFATLVLVFLITDFVRYKPIIIICSLSGTLTFLLLIYGQSIAVIQIVEFLYGLFFSTEVAYYTYIYAKVDKKHYQEVTGHTKAACLLGRCMAGIVAQLTTYFDLLDYHQLNYLSVAAIAFSTVWALFLPPAGQSIYFHKKADDAISMPINGIPATSFTEQQLRNSDQALCTSKSAGSFLVKIRRAYILLWKDFLQAYSNPHVLKWSCWSALSTCGYLQVISYIQLLWQTAVKPGDKIYNGAIDFLYSIIGTITVFGIGKVPLNWSVIGDVGVSTMSLLNGVLLLMCSYSYNIFVLYAGHILFGVIYHTMVTVASFEVAKYISQDSYGLIFGVNIFFALLLQSILTAIVLNGNLSLDLRTQFIVYGSYFTVIAVAYTFIGIINIVQQYKSGEGFNIWTEDVNTTRAVVVENETSPSR